MKYAKFLLQLYADMIAIQHVDIAMLQANVDVDWGGLAPSAEIVKCYQVVNMDFVLSPSSVAVTLDSLDYSVRIVSFLFKSQSMYWILKLYLMH